VKTIKYDIHINQNAAWNLRVTYNDETKTPIDLTGYAGELVIRKSIRSATSLIRINTAGSQVSFGDAIHNVVAQMTATQTDALPTNNMLVQDWVYSLLIWDPLDKDNTALRLLEGNVVVTPSVSRVDET